MPLADAPDELARGRRGSEAARRRSRRVAGRVRETLVEQPRRRGERRLVLGRRVEGHERLLDRPSRRTTTRLAMALVIETRSTRRTRAARGLAGVAMPAAWVSRGERRGREPEPVLARELHLAELVADHQLLDRAAAATASMIDSTYKR